MSEHSKTLTPYLHHVSSTINIEKLLKHCIGQPDFAMSLLQLFAETADERLADFELHSNRGDVQAVYELAHKLRGAAETVGATALHEKIIDVEVACGAPQAELDTALQTLYAEIGHVQQVIRQACAFHVPDRTMKIN